MGAAVVFLAELGGGFRGFLEAGEAPGFECGEFLFPVGDFGGEEFEADAGVAGDGVLVAAAALGEGDGPDGGIELGVEDFRADGAGDFRRGHACFCGAAAFASGCGFLGGFPEGQLIRRHGAFASC